MLEGAACGSGHVLRASWLCRKNLKGETWRNAPPPPPQVPPSHSGLVLKRKRAECECGPNRAPLGPRPLEEPAWAWGSVPGSVPDLALTQRLGSSVTSALSKQDRLSFILGPWPAAAGLRVRGGLWPGPTSPGQVASPPFQEAAGHSSYNWAFGARLSGFNSITALISCVTLDKFPTLSEPVSSLLNWGAGKSEGEDQHLPHWVFSALN